MKAFTYIRASSVDDAVAALHAHRDAKFLGGGTNLIDLMKNGVEQPAKLIDINRVQLAIDCLQLCPKLMLLLENRRSCAVEALTLGVRELLLHGGSPLGPPLVRAYGTAGTQATGVYWLYLGAFVLVFLAGAWAVLVRRVR